MSETKNIRQEGIIVAWSDDASGGIIQTPDLEPHYFNLHQWRVNDLKPAVRMRVTFEKISGRVRNVERVA